MMGVGPTVAACSFAAFLSGAQSIASTTGSSTPAFTLPKAGPERSFNGLPAGFPAPSTSEASARTVLPNEGLLIVGPERVTDALVGEILSFRNLGDGWDGERAVRPALNAIRDAVHFLYTAGSRAARLEPTLHVDGSVILEIEDGSEGSFRFKGDGRVICAVEGMSPRVLAFDGVTLPDDVETVLAR